VRDDLLLYYEQELNFLRQMGGEFADKYPKIASRLLLDPNKPSEDPHVERLLEGFAFLAARVHLKIDDDFPEITEALLTILYPHFIRPIPSMSVVQFQVDSGPGGLTTAQKVARGAILNSRPVGGVPCQFQTCYATTVWPINVVECEWKTPDRLSVPVKSADAVAAIRVELKCPAETSFDKLGVNSLRFYLSGEGNLVNALYELLCTSCIQILVRDPTMNSRVRPVPLRPEALRPVGFEEEESMLPYPRRSFVGYRLLQEYFNFPDKFFFIDVEGLSAAWANGFKDRAEIVFLLGPFEQQDRRQVLELGVNAKSFRLNCSPIINLFPQTAEPILLDQRKFEYQIVPDVRRSNATEVFSVNEVVSVNPQTNDVMKFEPFYSFRHAPMKEKQQTFWITKRRASARRNDEGTDVYVTMVNLSNRPVRPDADTLTIRTTCTNRDLPSRLPFGNDLGDFELEGGAAIKKIVALVKPTGTLRPPVGRNAQWRLLSHLSLNYLSLVDEGKEALQEILKLYNFTDSAYSAKQIEGIARIHSTRHFARVVSENGIAFARGARVEMELDEDQFVGGGAFLFASVLERFLSLYVSLNSFSQLVARTRQRKEVLKEWPPRAGRKILL
jgi:type VI secretion system protein ImpG